MRRILISSLMFFIFSGTKLSAYNDPPQWQWQFGFTHQSWDFGDDGEYGTPPMIMEGLPLGSEPDGEPNQINPYGNPSLNTFFNTHPFMKGWMYVPNSIDTERVAMYGGMGDTELTFTIPGVAAEKHCHKHVWVQTVVYARKDGEAVVDIELARNESFTDNKKIKLKKELIEPLDEPQGYSAAWYRVTQLYEIRKSGDAEYLRVRANYDPKLSDPDRMGASMIDRVDVDTRFINKHDLNGNGKVEYLDFSIIAAYWRTENPDIDFTGDGFVSEDDLLSFAASWLEGNSQY